MCHASTKHSRNIPGPGSERRDSSYLLSADVEAYSGQEMVLTLRPEHWLTHTSSPWPWLPPQEAGPPTPRRIFTHPHPPLGQGEDECACLMENFLSASPV